MDEFSQYERKGPDDFNQYERKATPVAPKYEPDFLMPGSKSEAFVRGFSNAATFGFGDEIQAGIRSMMPGSPTYKELRDQERKANDAASTANPWSYMGGNVVAALPQAGAVAKNIAGAGVKLIPKMIAGAKTAAPIGAAQGAGQAETISDIPAEAAKGAVINATLNAGVPVVGKLISKVGPGAGATFNKLKNAPAEVAKAPTPILPGAVKQALTLPGLGALGNMGRVNIGDGREDWSDPYSAITNTALAGAQGAAAGWAAQKGLDAVAKIPGVMGNVLTKDVSKWVNGQARLSPGTLPATAGNARQLVNAPFAKISSYMQKSQGGSNPKVADIAAKADEAVNGAANTGDAARKSSMILNSNPEGRAVTNSTSPVRDSNPESLDEYFRQLRGG